MEFKELTKQFIGFAVVGVVAFVIDYALLMILSQILLWDPVIAAFISYIVSTIFNYLASMRFVFERRDDISRKKEFTLFVVFSLIGLLLNEIIIALGTLWLGVGPEAVTFSKLLATVIVAIWNFVSRHHWLDASNYS
ncbi:GtrA family protein [uncultured Olegusella sp.]|uniref:GtrA family protein n=1 Tax=uncultured Olegusella sp. TaxID=1979846 RepID=UPI0026252D2B|nr:GtrA family protein [uncultured Olegusella sp.]